MEIGPLRVLIIAGDPLARAGLATLLEEREELHVVGQMAAGDSLLSDLDAYRPDVILWDFGWDPEHIPEALPDVELPVLALLPGDEVAERLAAEAWQAGVSGLLLREGEPERLVTALLTLAQELMVLDPALAPALRPGLPIPDSDPVEPLTPREQEVLQLVAEGLSNRAIAHQLTISEHTVKFHVNAIMTKLDAQSRTEAVVRATRLGLILL
jgi:DNA-binding NarL/FixJ family response regulator